MPTTVWAPDPLPELEGRVGLVQIDDALAETLLAADRVQNPAIGAFALRNPSGTAAPALEGEPDAGTYGTREMTSARAPKRAKSTKATDE
jgi:hypothetical protein